MESELCNLAYIDGSHHAKSKTSGWGFYISENNKITHEQYGEVEQKHLFDFEWFALAKLIHYSVKNNISDLHIFSDFIGIEKIFQKEGFYGILNKISQYVYFETTPKIKIKISHISRKDNKKADKLSRQYLEDLFLQEKNLMQKNLKNNILNGFKKHPKINFLHTSQMIYRSNSTVKSAERKVLYAVKNEYLIIEISCYDIKSSIKIMKYKNKHYTILKEYFIETTDIIKTISNEINLNLKEKRILLALDERLESLYFDLIYGKIPNSLFNDLNNLDECFVHNKVFTISKNRRRLPKKNTKNLNKEELVKIYTENPSKNKRIKNFILGEKINEFTQINHRKPSRKEIDDIIKTIDMSCEVS